MKSFRSKRGFAHRPFGIDLRWVFVFSGAAVISVACSGDDLPACEETQSCIKTSQAGEGGEGDQGGTSGNSNGGSSARGGSGGRGGSGATAGRGGASGGSGASGTSGASGAAGAGGSGGDEPPTVESFTPEDGSADVERDIEVTAELSEAIDPATVTETSVTLTGPDGDVPGTVDVDDNVISFVPDSPLYLLGTYTITLGDTIADLDGNTLERAASAEFQVRDGRWSSTIVTPFGTTGRYLGGFARNGNGDVLIGGTQPTTPDGTMWAAVYAAEEKRWLPVDTMAPGQDVFNPSWQGMSLDNERRAVISWTTNIGDYGWFRFTESGGWTDAGALPGYPLVAVSSQGKATAVWTNQVVVETRTLDVDSGALEAVKPVYNGEDYDVQIVASLDRKAVFSLRPAGSGREISMSWQTATGFSARDPMATAAAISQWRVESDEQGNIVLLWTEANETTGDRIWSRVYEQEKAMWTADQLVLSAPPFSGFANPVMSGGNAAIVVYGGDMVVSGACYEKGVGWVQSSKIELDGLGDFEWASGEIAVELGIDRRGNVLAVGKTGYRRYLPGDGWQPIQTHGLALGKWRLWMAAAPDGSLVAVTHDLTANEEFIPQSVLFE